MHSRIIHNDRLIELSHAQLPAVTSTTLYGRGVFTTLAVYRGQPFLWPEHWGRLIDHAERCGVGHSHLAPERIKASLMHLLEVNEVKDGRARVTLLTRSLGGMWQSQTASDIVSNMASDMAGDMVSDTAGVEVETDVLLLTGDARSVAAEGLALTLSPYRLNTLSPLTGVKSVNYLEHVIAREEAHGRGFDEAVVLNERGEIVSATMANLFWVKRGTIRTPALATGALAGTTRACTIALAAELAFPLVEGIYDTSDLGDADEIFLTSAAHGIAPVTTYDFHRYTVAAGSLVLRLGEAFRQLTLQP